MCTTIKVSDYTMTRRATPKIIIQYMKENPYANVEMVNMLDADMARPWTEKELKAHKELKNQAELMVLGLSRDFGHAR